VDSLFGVIELEHTHDALVVGQNEVTNIDCLKKNKLKTTTKTWELKS